MIKSVGVFLLIFFLFFPFVSSGNDHVSSDEEPLPKPAKKHFTRGLLECLTLFTISATNYQIEYKDWMEDWQFELNWRDQKKRFFSTEALFFDSNSYLTNWTHAISGTLYYNFARTNGLGTGSSFLFGLCFSTAWEYFVEWREVISVNDLILTPFGGWAIGEPLYQLSNSFLSQRSLAAQIMGTILNPLLAINHLLDGKTIYRRDPQITGCLRQTEFHLGPAQWNGSDTPNQSLFSGGADFRLVSISDLFSPGEERSFSWKPLYSEAKFQLAMTTNGVVEEHGFSTKTVLGGFWGRKMEEQPDSSPSGYAYFLGLGAAFSMYKKKAIVSYDQGTTGNLDPRELKEVPSRFRDKMAVLSVTGPSAQFFYQKGRLFLRFGADLFLDFGMINSLPLNLYSSRYEIDGLETTVISWGYYYALGYTLAPEFYMKSGNFNLTLQLKRQAYTSIEGLDRFQSQVTDPSRQKDSRTQLHISVGYFFPGTNLGLKICYDDIYRRGSIGGFVDTYQEGRIYYCFQLSFQ